VFGQHFTHTWNTSISWDTGPPLWKAVPGLFAGLHVLQMR
jgi:hypothetical protein